MKALITSVLFAQELKKVMIVWVDGLHILRTDSLFNKKVKILT